MRLMFIMFPMMILGAGSLQIVIVHRLWYVFFCGHGAVGYLRGQDHKKNLINQPRYLQLNQSLLVNWVAGGIPSALILEND